MAVTKYRRLEPGEGPDSCISFFPIAFKPNGEGEPVCVEGECRADPPVQSVVEAELGEWVFPRVNPQTCWCTRGEAIA